MFSVPKNKQGSTTHSRIRNRLACDLRGLNNNSFSADNREIAAKSSFSAQIISSKSQTKKSADHQHGHETLKTEYKSTRDGIHPCGTPEDKERGVDFTPSTSTTIERSRRNDETMPIAEVRKSYRESSF
jgi:hypothetical protein